MVDDVPTGAARRGECMTVRAADVDGVLVATIDDGKANALSTEVIDGLRAALAVASERGQPLVVTGRDGYYSAGFDLAVIRGGDKALASALLSNGGHLYREVVEAPVPVVASCTGHAIAGGALLLLCADYRIGRAGPYRLGLNEVTFGMALPSLVVAIATDRLESRYLTMATMFAHLAPPERAMAMGYLDEVVDDPLPRACEFARSTAALPARAFATTKRRVRGRLQQELAALEL
ncbi:MAG: crotonase/enoyl-CoA hydratase family protein [Acidimicrobiales bacterium]